MDIRIGHPPIRNLRAQVGAQRRILLCRRRRSLAQPPRPTAGTSAAPPARIVTRKSARLLRSIRWENRRLSLLVTLTWRISRPTRQNSHPRTVSATKWKRSATRFFITRSRQTLKDASCTTRRLPSRSPSAPEREVRPLPPITRGSCCSHPFLGIRRKVAILSFLLDMSAPLPTRDSVAACWKDASFVMWGGWSSIQTRRTS